MIRLVTRGDDAGSFRSANTAMRDAFTNGIMRNAGLMAPTGELQHAADQLRDLKGLCLGLHLTMTSEWDEPRWGPVLPASEIPSLVRSDGTFFHDSNEFYENDPKIDEFLEETAAQLKVLRDLDLEIRYLDEHMGVAWREDFAAALADFAERENLVFRPNLKSLKRPARDKDETDHATRFLNALQAADDGDYLVVAHPCYPEGDVMEIRRGNTPPGHHGRDRNGQREVFMREDVVTYVRDNNIALLRYDEV